MRAPLPQSDTKRPSDRRRRPIRLSGLLQGRYHWRLGRSDWRVTTPSCHLRWRFNRLVLRSEKDARQFGPERNQLPSNQASWNPVAQFEHVGEKHERKKPRWRASSRDPHDCSEPRAACRSGAADRPCCRRALLSAVAWFPAGEAFEVATPDGFVLSARAYGDPSRPEIVLIHGLGQSQLSWDCQVSSFLTTNYRIVTFDLRGHGDSSKPADVAAYSSNDRWADDLTAVIKATGLRKPTLVGWSLGGVIIGSYLVKYGDEHTGGIVLVDALTALDMSLMGEAAQESVPKIMADDVAVRAEAIPRFLALCFVNRPPEADFDRMVAFNGMVPTAVNKGILGLSDNGFDQAFRDEKHVLLIHGRHDAMVTLGMSERVTRLNRGARLSVYKKSGHAPFFEEAEQFNRELAAFVGD